MNKKKFTKSLDSLFEVSEGGSSTTVLTKKESKRAKKTSTRQPGKYRKRFTSDLDTLFETVLSEERQEKKEKSEPKERRRRGISVRGLNSLIRKTTDPDLIKDEDDSKRVTFSYTKKAYRKLKKIASQRGLFLREVIGEVLNTYIDKYEKENGPLDD